MAACGRAIIKSRAAFFNLEGSLPTQRQCLLALHLHAIYILMNGQNQFQRQPMVAQDTALADEVHAQ